MSLTLSVLYVQLQLNINNKNEKNKAKKFDRFKIDCSMAGFYWNPTENQGNEKHK